MNVFTNKIITIKETNLQGFQQINVQSTQL